MRFEIKQIVNLIVVINGWGTSQLAWDECHWILLMISKQWFRKLPDLILTLSLEENVLNHQQPRYSYNRNIWAPYQGPFKR